MKSDDKSETPGWHPDVSDGNAGSDSHTPIIAHSEQLSSGEWALEYASRGLYVFPIVPGDKKPACKWRDESTTDQERIRAWWGKNPKANIGLDCGKSGILAIDLDTKNGQDGPGNWDALGYSSDTAMSKTPSGGFHVIYSYSGKDIGNSASKLAQGIDVRGEGGYIVLPPSSVNGASYEWVDDCAPVRAPDGLIASLRRPIVGPTAPRSVQGNGYGEKALALEVQAVAGAPQGNRNHQLNASAFSLGQLVGGGVLGEDEVISVLLDACAANGLLAEDGERQCRKSIESGLSAGREDPRGVPEKGLSDAPRMVVEQNAALSTARKAWTVDNLFDAEFPTPRWAVPGLVPAGLTFLGGRPKVGKSWLALQIAIAVGTGGKVFDNDVERGKVLFLAFEDSPRRLKDRLLKQRCPRGADVTFVTEWKHLQDGGLEDIRGVVERDGYTLVIIDTLARSLGRADQMDIGVMGEIIGGLQTLAHELDITILALEHHRKPSIFNHDPIDDIIGSTGKSAPVDTAIGLYRDKDGAKLMVRGRDLEDINLTLTWDRETCCWQSEGKTEDVERSTVRNEIKEALQELDDLGQLPTTKAISEYTGKDQGLVNRELKTLVSYGIAVKGEKVGREQPYYMAGSPSLRSQ